MLTESEVLFVADDEYIKMSKYMQIGTFEIGFDGWLENSTDSTRLLMQTSSSAMRMQYAVA